MEKKFHELTSELIPEKATAYVIKKSHTDSIIRKWLEERAAKLCEYCEGPLPREIYKELRLNHDGKPMTWKTAITDEKPEQKQSWCACGDNLKSITFGTPSGDCTIKGNMVHYCPSCGTPRPTPKSLVDKFREKTCYLLPDKDNPSTNKTGRLTSGCAWRLARIAEEHFGKTDFLREHKEEL